MAVRTPGDTRPMAQPQRPAGADSTPPLPSGPKAGLGWGSAHSRSAPPRSGPHHPPPSRPLENVGGFLPGARWAHVAPLGPCGRVLGGVGEAPGGFVVCDIDIDIDINIDSNSAMHSTKHSVSLVGGSTNWVMAQAAASTDSSGGGGGGLGGPGCYCTDMSSCTCGGRGQQVQLQRAVAPPPALVTRTSDAELAAYWAQVAALAVTGTDGPRQDAEMAPVRAEPLSQPADTLPLWAEPLSQPADGTGLSQGVTSLQLDAAASAASFGTVPITLRRDMWEQFLENEVLRSGTWTWCKLPKETTRERQCDFRGAGLHYKSSWKNSLPCRQPRRLADVGLCFYGRA